MVVVRHILKRLALCVALYALLMVCTPVPDLVLTGGRVPSVRLLDRNGQVLREFLSSEDGTAVWVSLQELPSDVPAAMLAAEDHRFWSHWGVDPIAVGRAVMTSMRSRQVVSGASTIPMQLVANAYGREPRTAGRKIWETVAALRLSWAAPREVLLERYLNTVPFGHQTFGIEAAARFYFGRSARQLSLGQAAFLCALPCSPATYDPFTAPHLVEERRQYIIDRMDQLGFVSKDRADAARLEHLAFDKDALQSVAPHFTDYARTRLHGRSGDVLTTLDAALQKDVEALVQTHLKSLQRKDVTQAAVIVLHNPTGEVLAMVGSADFGTSQVNGALARRQPGSALKPFMYGIALQGGATPSTLIPDLPMGYRTPQGTYVPQNFDGMYHGPVRLRTALACSYNAPAVKLLSDKGAEALLDTLHAAGFESLDRSARHYGLGLTLGNGEVTLLELANAYRMLARRGVYSPSHIFMSDGRVGTFDRRVFSPQVSYLLTHILQDKAARAPAFGARSVLNMPFPCAAKSGTSRDFRDNWTAGYTNRYTVAVWVGNFDSRPMKNVSGVTGAGRLFRHVMLRLHDGAPPDEFAVPPGLVWREVCPDSGDLVGAFCTSRMREVFMDGATPEQSCQVHQRIGGQVVMVWPSIYAEWFRTQRLPDQRTAHTGPPGITSPQPGATYRIDPSMRREYQAIRFSVRPPAETRSVTWTVDGRAIGRLSAPFDTHWQLTEGTHEVVAHSEGWVSTPVRIHVVGTRPLPLQGNLR